MSSNAWLSGVSRFFTPLYWLVVIALLLCFDGFDELDFSLWQRALIVAPEHQLRGAMHRPSIRRYVPHRQIFPAQQV
jgi:hypothetical protein